MGYPIQILYRILFTFFATAHSSLSISQTLLEPPIFHYICVSKKKTGYKKGIYYVQTSCIPYPNNQSLPSQSDDNGSSFIIIRSTPPILSAIDLKILVDSPSIRTIFSSHAHHLISFKCSADHTVFTPQRYYHGYIINLCSTFL